MRIMAVGTKLITRKLILALAGSEFELVCPSDIAEVVTRLKQDKFDLVVVDSLATGVETTCRHIRDIGNVPIILMIGQEQPDWKGIQSLGVNGYIAQKVSGSELVARLRAVLRRFWPAGELNDGLYIKAPEILAEFSY